MLEIVLAVVIVGAALFFTGRALVRSLRSEGKGGCYGGCAGCSRSAVDNGLEKGEEVRRK